MYEVHSVDPAGGLQRMCAPSSLTYAIFGIGRDFAHLGCETAVSDDSGLIAIVTPYEEANPCRAD